MPIFGEMDVDAALVSAPLLASLAESGWSLPGARYVQVSYEVEHRGALQLTPPSLHPSVPPYATLSALSCPESPDGPFTLVQVRLVVRAGIRPRALLLGAYCSSPSVAGLLAAGWGWKVAAADVGFSPRHDSVRSAVRVDGRLVLEIEAADYEPVGLGDLTLLDNLHLVRLQEPDASEPVGAIVQVDPIYVVKSADRGRPVLREFDPDAFGCAGRLKLTAPVTAIVCSCDVELPRPRFVMDTKVPALQSSRKLAA
jgi:hypothetical protein